MQQQKDALCLQAALTRGARAGVCLAHRHENANPFGLYQLKSVSDSWGCGLPVLNLPKPLFRKKIKVLARVKAIEGRKQIKLDHDAKYGRGSAAMCNRSLLSWHFEPREHESEVKFWHRMVVNSVHREAVLRAKFGLLPFIKATVFKWGSQLAKFSEAGAARLMACGCGHAFGASGALLDLPQDVTHVLEECKFSEGWRLSVFEEIRTCVLEHAGRLRIPVWDSWSVAKRMEFLFTAHLEGTFGRECESRMKSILAKHLAYLFLNLGNWYGGNVPVRQLEVNQECLRAGQVVDRACFVEVV